MKVRFLLLAAGGVNLWTVATANYWWFQVGSGVIGAICFVSAGIMWERSTPTFADSLARSVYGATDATELLLTLPLLAQEPSSGE